MGLGEVISKLDEFDIFDKLGRISSSRLKQLPNNLVVDIIEATQFLQHTPKLSIRIRAIYNNICSHPICEVCDTPVLYTTGRSKYSFFSKYCSAVCSTKSKSRQQNTESTNLNRYGVKYQQSSDAGKRQRVSTNLKKYGHASPASNSDVRNKIKQTNLKKYGNENLFGSEFGKNKIKQTNMDRYHNASYQSSTLSEQTQLLLNNIDWLKDQNHKSNNDLTTIATNLNCSVSCVHQHFKKHNIPVFRQKQSKFEREISTFINDNGYHTHTNSKIEGVEFDIIIPKLNIAIECNGIYWHGETKGRGRTYHLNKTKIGSNNKYKVIHIFEHDWVFRSDIIKSRILYQLGLSRSNIYARKCKVIEVSTRDANEFFALNHLQGKGNSSINYGLLYDDNIVAVMGLGKDRFNTGAEFEIIRYSSALNTNVVGGLGKLFNCFVRANQPQSVISFADICWGYGNGYEQIGFTFKYNTDPTYSYFKTNDCLELFNRQQFQKHKLSSVLDIFDPNMSEWDNMINNKYDRIWNCGNSKWMWKKE